MLRIAVCDDDALCIRKTTEYLHQYAETAEEPILVFPYDNADDLIDRYQSERVDIILMDIMMPLLSGMEAAAEIRKADSTVKIVFLTSSPEFAVESYDVKASGYLLKPIQPQKLFSVLQDCQKALQSDTRFITVKTAVGYRRLMLNAIECLEAQNKKVQITLTDGTRCESFAPFSHVSSLLLREDGFFQCHRSYIVSLEHIDHFSNNECQTRSGAVIPIARGTGKLFKEAYIQYMFEEGSQW